MTFPNPQMVVEINYTLRNWWIDIKSDHEREICQLLGGLTYLIFVIPNPLLIRALLKFWDPVRMVFKFVDFDLAPTIEEISGFIDLPYHECEMMTLGGFISTFYNHALAERIIITLLVMSLSAPSRNGKHII
ncbi:hypothetical protein KY290_001468 [Solanum tuberosum]|uniref:DUF7745 domain-containing protein n=1 Tax=Solanum tuberosum TaxID=4113 RepID=A0ABQ7WME5_SOLTU|nr:hypothetical protein KY290_001468 [Solanum tuberosum]